MSTPTLKFLIAWELGRNYGHLARTACLALALRRQGHEVLFAVRDVNAARFVLGPLALPFVQAALPAGTGQRPPPVSYADILMATGYEDVQALEGRLMCWAELIGLFRPHLVIADFAPTATIAARAKEIPVVAIGHGFQIPPKQEPLPSIQPWVQTPHERLKEADSDALDVINSALVALGWRPLDSLTDLFDVRTNVLTTFPELDHYSARQEARYAGVFYDLPVAKSAQWPTGRGPRVLAYLHHDTPGLGLVLECLKQLTCRAIVVVPGASPDSLSRFLCPHIAFHQELVNVDSVLAEIDVAVGYGSIGFATKTLLAGIPQLMLPPYFEQRMFARRVVELGAGISMVELAHPAERRRAIEDLLTEPRFRHAAERFAMRHSNYDAQEAVQGIAQQLIQSATDAL